MFFRRKTEDYIKTLNLNQNSNSRRFVYLIKEPCGALLKIYLWIILVLLGVIYFMWSGDIYGIVFGFILGIPFWLLAERVRGVYKIGITKNLKSRLSQINNGNARKVYYVHYKMFDEASVTEKKLHDIFGKSRMEGEWFHLWFWQVWWLWLRYFR